ncbi:HET-domain-containing protein [Xylaria longipes]|nr:HET-domain-containing protein [Xylaria longipes]
MTRTIYSSLRRPEQDFRLILLLPGDLSSNIHCRLLVSSLDYTPDFEALSYVWGDTNDKLAISMDGQAHNVTRNLHSALDFLRYPDRVRTLWVDALCINQDDTNERNHQLGKVNHEDEDTIRLIETAGEYPNLHWTELLANFNILTLFLFLINPWWDRVWTAQEAVLARELTFQYGRKSISRANMMGMLKSFSAHITSCCVGLIKTWGKGLSSLALLGLVELQLSLEEFRLGVYGRSFSQAVGFFWHRGATNPRDKVYGLLGLIDDAQYITVDYDSPIEMVYENCARGTITKSCGLDLFSHLTGPVRSKTLLYDDSQMLNLPSWVPDWNSGFRHRIGLEPDRAQRLLTLNLFKACGSHLFNPSRSDEAGSLRVSGIAFDTVEKISPLISMPEFDTTTIIRFGRIALNTLDMITPSLSEIDDAAEVIREWRNMARVEEEPDRPYPSGGTILDAFWRTLCLDVSSRRPTENIRKRAGPEDRKDHDHFWLFSLLLIYDEPSIYRLVDDPQKSEVLGFTGHILESIICRRFFFSKNGYMGLAPDGIQQGDMICVLAGGHVQFILRRAGTASANSPETEVVCTILGEAYLHGIMDGEAVRKVDEGKEQFQSFKLI